MASRRFLVPSVEGSSPSIPVSCPLFDEEVSKERTSYNTKNDFNHRQEREGELLEREKISLSIKTGEIIKTNNKKILQRRQLSNFRKRKFDQA